MRHCPTITVPDADTFATAGAEAIALCIRRSLETHDRCTLALSGGSTPGPVYRRLAESDLEWQRVVVLLADERCVPDEDAQSNHRLVQETLLDHLRRPPARFLAPPTDLSSPDLAASAYDDMLSDLLDENALSVAVLGMGPDGHIASLFPPLTQAALGPTKAIAVTQDRFAVTDRISLTLPVLRGAGESVFLLSGVEKKKVWDTMLAAENDVLKHPAQALVETGRCRLVAQW